MRLFRSTKVPVQVGSTSAVEPCDSRLMLRTPCSQTALDRGQWQLSDLKLCYAVPANNCSNCYGSSRPEGTPTLTQPEWPTDWVRIASECECDRYRTGLSNQSGHISTRPRKLPVQLSWHCNELTRRYEGPASRPQGARLPEG